LPFNVQPRSIPKRGYKRATVGKRKVRLVDEGMGLAGALFGAQSDDDDDDEKVSSSSSSTSSMSTSSSTSTPSSAAVEEEQDMGFSLQDMGFSLFD